MSLQIQRNQSVTKKEIAYILGYNEVPVHEFFIAAGKSGTPMGNQIKEKSKHYSKMKAVNFTLEETLYAMSFNPVWNPAMKQFLIENFVDRPTDVYDRTNAVKYVNQSAINFLSAYERKIDTPCCNTCRYCSAQQPNKAGTRLHPYCNFYDKFVAKMGKNVYRHSCRTYDRYYGFPQFWEPNLPTDYYGFRKAVESRYRRKRQKPRGKDDWTV